MKQDERTEAIKHAMQADAKHGLAASPDLWPALQLAVARQQERLGQRQIGWHKLVLGPMLILTGLIVTIGLFISPWLDSPTFYYAPEVADANACLYAESRDVGGYSVPCKPPTPTALPAFPAQSDPVTAVRLYYEAFNDTIRNPDPEQRFGQMYSMMLPAFNLCDKQRFVAMQLAINGGTGTYNTVDVQPVFQLSSDQQQAIVIAKVSTVFAIGTQNFTLIKRNGGWLITAIGDEVNGPDYNWPPNPNAAWYKQVKCGGK